MKVSKFKIGMIEFIVTECPHIDQLEEFKNIINILIRILEPSQLYDISVPNLTVVDFTDFQDGSVPTLQVIERYIQIIEDAKKKYKNPNILAHCVSSMGRCPTFLGISMIKENPKIDRFEIINEIRKKRKGALNLKQVNFLLDIKIEENKKKWWNLWKK